jgi:hypothetical protein
MDRVRFEERAQEGHRAAELQLGGLREGRQLRRGAFRDPGVPDERDATGDHENAPKIAVSLFGLLCLSEETGKECHPQQSSAAETTESLA